MQQTADRVRVTPAMIVAGAAVLRDCKLVDDHALVRRIFEAMDALRPVRDK